MRSKCCLTKNDVVVALGSGLFLLAALGSIGDGGRRRAKEAVCVSNLRCWGHIFVTFADDHDGYLMGRWDGVYWAETLGSYYENRRLLLCPEATRTGSEGGRNPFMAWPVSVEPGRPKGSYVINLWIANENKTGSMHPGGVVAYWRTPYVAGAASVPVLIDGQMANMQPYAFDRPPEYETDIWTPGPRDEMRRACVSRHNGGVNAVFLDGSVRKVAVKCLWRIHWHRIWEEELAQSGFPVWPEWMANFKNPQ